MDLELLQHLADRAGPSAASAAPRGARRARGCGASRSRGSRSGCRPGSPCGGSRACRGPCGPTTRASPRSRRSRSRRCHMCGAKIGLCLPRSSVATSVASRPRMAPSASIDVPLALDVGWLWACTWARVFLLVDRRGGDGRDTERREQRIRAMVPSDRSARPPVEAGLPPRPDRCAMATDAVDRSLHSPGDTPSEAEARPRRAARLGLESDRRHGVHPPRRRLRGPERRRPGPLPARREAA